MTFKREDVTIIVKQTAQVPSLKDRKKELRYGNGQQPFTSKKRVNKEKLREKAKGDDNAHGIDAWGKTTRGTSMKTVNWSGVHEDKNGECKRSKNGIDVLHLGLSFATAKTDELRVGAKGIIMVVMIPRGGASKMLSH